MGQLPKKIMLLALFLGASFSFTGLAVAAPDNQCRLHQELSPERLLRRLSIDLRGQVPSFEDYALVEGRSDVPEAAIDGMLASDGFRKVMRRYHELLLWPNPYGARMITQNFVLSTISMGGISHYFIPSVSRATAFRGGDGSHRCQDVHQDVLGWNADGSPVCQAKGVDNLGAYCQEGYVDVHPYWEANPSTTIRVCAFDAQTTETYDFNGKATPCNQRFSNNEKECGCGPNLRFCMRYNNERDVWTEWREQLLRLVDDYTDGTRPYGEMLTTQRSYTNGRLDFQRKYFSAQTTYPRVYTQLGKADAPLMQNPQWFDTQWVEVMREKPHAGILTLPAFLLRFQTNRGRANRFRIVFTGQYFQPPKPETEDCLEDGNDLTKRCTCRKCHSVLEPLAAHFGNFAEAGSTPLDGFATSYPSSTACREGDVEPNTGFCNRFYAMVRDVKDPDIKLWKLLALEWADSEHPKVQENFDSGPAGIVAWAKASGAFYRATVKNLFKFLMKREMILTPGAADSEDQLLEQLSSEFQAHESIKELTKSIVQLPQYRRMP